MPKRAPKSERTTDPTPAHSDQPSYADPATGPIKNLTKGHLSELLGDMAKQTASQSRDQSQSKG